MKSIRTFSLSRHSKLFSVPDNGREYLFVRSGDTPYQEEPYRAESYALAYIKEGGVRINVGLSSWEAAAPSIITLAPSDIRFFTKSSDLLKMDVIFFRDTFLMERYPDPFFLSKFDFFGNDDHHVLPLADAGFTKINSIYELIHLTHETGNVHKAELVRNYIFALIYEIDGGYRQNHILNSMPQREHPLFLKFRQLLRSNYLQERKLDFYAENLHLTPKSLSAAIKKQTGKPAGKWIDDAVTLEAKVLLQNETLTVAQVAEMLNFSDQSVFGKFFRANAGLSPIEYRKKFS
ncbi:AraC-type DNA-binding protein [Dyadobacter soli]|uniref:AraC-type DNA-binding protein n=1 Tax=Dyadobacter soli TaxID=659014 RepID=A0A1G7Y3P2_9BACT|nr:AraC family transcriptional regulator [Dyadobacter soli]SDG90866.1 AraC-type DNA-binding protein [Dyadobacter soli]